MYRIYKQREYLKKNKKTGAEELMTPVLLVGEGSYPTIDEAIQDAENFISTLDESERYNLYVSVHKTPDTGKRDFEGQKHIFIDIDGIDSNADHEQYKEAILKAIGKDCVTIISSGNGYHVLIELENYITDKRYFKSHRQSYQDLCRKIGAELSKNGGLKGVADPAVFAAGRLVRLPYSNNVKKGKADKPVKLIYKGNGKPIKFITDIEGVGEYKEDITDTISDNTLKKIKFKPDPVAIQNDCGFIKFCREEPTHVKEPQWYASLSILSRAHGMDNERQLGMGRKLCHDYSKLDLERYEPENTEAKIEQALASAGPRTCENISSLFDGCKACPHLVHSPLELKREEHIASENNGFRLPVKGRAQKGQVDHQDLIKAFRRDYKFINDIQTNTLYSFNGDFYEPIILNKVEQYAYRAIKYPVSTIAERKEFLRMVYLEDDKEENFFLQDDGMINLKNGMYDLKKNKLLDNTKGDKFFTYKLDYDYDPQAVSPRWDLFLKEVTQNDQQKEDFLMEYIAYIMSATCPSKGQISAILLGDGSNGKSTFLEVLKSLISLEVCGFNRLTDFSDGGKLASLRHKLVNIAEETPYYKSLSDSSVFKDIVGGGTLAPRVPYAKEPLIFKTLAKVIFACNELPKNFDATHGFIRRMCVVEFNARFEGSTDNKNLKEELIEERSGILNRVIKAYDRLKKNKFKFTAIDSSKEVIEDYRKESDRLSFVDEFLNDGPFTVTNDPNDETPIKDIYEALLKHCKLLGIRVNATYPSVCKRIKSRVLECNIGDDGKYKQNQRMVNGKRITFIKGILASEIGNDDF
ncbi:MAG: DNA primase family protein [Bacteriovoracaceae bacterium]